VSLPEAPSNAVTSAKSEPVCTASAAASDALMAAASAAASASAANDSDTVTFLLVIMTILSEIPDGGGVANVTVAVSKDHRLGELYAPSTNICKLSSPDGDSDNMNSVSTPSPANVSTMLSAVATVRGCQFDVVKLPQVVNGTGTFAT